MATAVQVPVEVYLASDYEPDAEYVDGCIEGRPAGQYDHASWQQAIQFWFAQHSKEWNVRVRHSDRPGDAADRSVQERRPVGVGGDGTATWREPLFYRLEEGRRASRLGS